MTERERLHVLVDQLGDDEAAELLRLASDLYEVPGQRRPLPTFVGMGDSRQSDVSERAEEILAAEFGRAPRQ
jgi:hypothetical protein